MSNDRLKRVQEATDNNENKKKHLSRRLVFRREASQTESPAILTLRKNEVITIEDWCTFEEEKNYKNVFLLGNILAFRYATGRTLKETKYSWQSTPVDAPKNVIPRGIEVLATWFVVDSDVKLIPVDGVISFYINMNKYMLTFDCPNLELDEESGCLKFTNEIAVLQQFQEQLLRFSKKT